MRLKIILLSVIVAFATVSADGAAKRTSKAVQKEKKETLRKIERTKAQIKANDGDMRRGMAQLQRVEAEIRRSDAVIAGTRQRIDSLELRMSALSDSIASGERRVATLKANLASSLRTLRNQRQVASPTAYVFSSKSFTEARKRLRYLDELSRWQSDKTRALKDQLARLETQHGALEESRGRLATAMERLDAEQATLAEKHKAARSLTDGLRRNARQLEKVLAENQARARRLDKELDRIIEEEMRRAREEEERRAREQAAAAAKAKAAGQAAPKTPAQDTPAPGKDFASAKGHLPMPVSGNAIIVSDFGRHKHKDYTKVETVNNGIDIEATPGSSAVAVFPGTVTMVTVMDGFHNVVLVRHGEYLTVYAGIGTLAVRKGDTVRAGQSLGKIYADPASGTRLHFEVRHEREKLDPADWLR